MKKINVFTIVGTRPEIIRLSETIKRLNNSSSINHVLVHTGQNYDYELNKIFFEDFKLPKPDYFLNVVGNNLGQTIGNIISKTYDLLSKKNPDVVLVLGDTDSCLSAISAKRLKIPIFHMEAGNRCFDLRVPEEINRRIVDHIADINLPYSTISRDYLIREGIHPSTIIKTGSPMYEVINSNIQNINNSSILNKLGLSKEKYFIVSFHRAENVDDRVSIEKIINSLNIISDKYNYPILISTHPRTKKRIEEYELTLNENIQLLKPLGFFDYVNLQINSLCVISDSGTITEESSILGFKAINLRDTHERPEGFEEAPNIMSGLNFNNIINSIDHIVSSDIKMKIVDDYSKQYVSEKIVRIIISYHNYVNKYIWKKDN